MSPVKRGLSGQWQTEAYPRRAASSHTLSLPLYISKRLVYRARALLPHFTHSNRIEPFKTAQRGKGGNKIRQ